MSPRGPRLARAGVGIGSAWLLLATAASVVAAPTGHHRRPPRRSPARSPARARWLTGVAVTEYFPVPEAWFIGQRVPAPGLPGRHRIDWLYSARGLAMEGDGLDTDGNPAHIESLGSGGWVNASGQRTDPASPGWSHGDPFWRAGAYWLSGSGQVTFPLEVGGWSSGTGQRYVAPPGMTFAPGPSGPLAYYRSIAVDPHVIPLGSRVYIPAYRSFGPSRGWFVAQDTGGAVGGRHVDVYRPPPPSPTDPGRSLQDQRVYVVPPGARSGLHAPPGAGGPPGPAGGGGSAGGGSTTPTGQSPGADSGPATGAPPSSAGGTSASG